jgi:signal transduction histidine kinase
MILASDQNLDPEKLSLSSRKMLELREVVLQQWESKTRAAFKEARELREPVFIDTIPVFYDNLLEAISPGYPRANAVEGTSIAYAHGGERARLTNYDPQMLILEYQIFRSALFSVLGENDVRLNKEELLVINNSIDEAIRESVMAFSAAVAALREQFIASLAHDLRAPLHTASMVAELITLTTDSPKTKELANKIVDNIQRADHMAQSLLDTMAFSKGQNLRLMLSNFDILDIAKEVVQTTKEKDGIQCKLIGESIYGWWGRDALRRSLENLISNAIKYGDVSKPITITFTKQHGNLILSVHNEGAPVPIEEQAAIFQAFRRAENAQKGDKPGWGIGLPYVRAVMESLGGSIVVDSALGRGTTFTINIPIDSRHFQNAPIQE